MSRGPGPPSPYRRPLIALSFAAAAGLALWQRPRYMPRHEREPVDPIPLDELRPSDLSVAVSPDADHGSASAAIDAQLDALRATGRGGRLLLPPRDWTVDRPIALDVDHLHLTGSGIRATRLHMAEGRRGNLIEIDGHGVTVERLTLSGVGAAGADDRGHGIRVGSSATDLCLRDLVIEDVPSYGVGFQPRDADIGDRRIAGLFDGITMRNVVIRRCGQDGIDIKNIDEEVAACRSGDLEQIVDDCNGRRTFFRNLTISDVGRRAGVDNEKPAIDVRGIRSLQNVEMLDLRDGAFGIRFRRDPGGRPNGLGGNGSIIENFLVIQGPSESPGVEREGTYGVEARNGFVVDDGHVQRFPA